MRIRIETIILIMIELIFRKGFWIFGSFLAMVSVFGEDVESPDLTIETLIEDIYKSLTLGPIFDVFSMEDSPILVIGNQVRGGAVENVIFFHPYDDIKSSVKLQDASVSFKLVARKVDGHVEYQFDLIAGLAIYEFCKKFDVNDEDSRVIHTIALKREYSGVTDTIFLARLNLDDFKKYFVTYSEAEIERMGLKRKKSN